MSTRSHKIAKTAIIYPNVVLGKNVVVEDYCLIGCPSKQCVNEKTIIGDGARIRSHSVIYAGNRIGTNFQTGNGVNIREMNVIGNDVSIGTHTVIEHHVVIEDNVRIHTCVFIPEYSILKKDSWIGPQVTFTNAKYPKHPDSKKNLKGPTIGERAIVGAGVVILPAVNIGSHSLIGAGSVVTKNVDKDSIYAGNPARFIKKINY